MAPAAIRFHPGQRLILSDGVRNVLRPVPAASARTGTLHARAGPVFDVMAMRSPRHTDAMTRAYARLKAENTVRVVGISSWRTPALMRKLSGVAMIRGAEPERPVCQTVPSPR